MKKLLRNLLSPTLLTSAVCVYAPIMVAFLITPKVRAKDVEYKKGVLGVQNYVYDFDFQQDICYIVHRQEGTEDYDTSYDRRYNPILWFPSGKKTKIVSIIPGYELLQDARPLDSFTPINLELAIHTQWEGPITFPNVQNELRCNLLYAESFGWDFGNKPITLWRRFPAEPDKLQFLADIREAIDKSEFYTSDGKTAQIPIHNLDGEHGSQVPYDWLQVRFDVYPGNLNFGLDTDGQVLDGIVDMKDLAILGNDWGKQGEPKEFVGDITGPQGLPDGRVDYQDLELLTRYWLKDIRDIMPSP